MTPQDRGLWTAFVGDGGNLILFTGLALFASGAFALFQSATGHFLPHDVAYLGMTAEQLCSRNQCKIVHFMIHDRVAFGGVLIAIGILYMWLSEFPLRHGEPWAWWTLLVSGISGFGSFLVYLGYGYLDTWHGVATLALLPLFSFGLVLKFKDLLGDRSIRCLLVSSSYGLRSGIGLGKRLLLFTSAGIIFAGCVITLVGMTVVFVPQDLEYLALKRADLHAINARLIPLIAHDRAGFGGGLVSCGIILFFTIFCAKPSKSLWQVVSLSGVLGFSAAIGIHPLIGYTNVIHLAPAIVGAVLFLGGIVLIRPIAEPTR
jgi:hypothetical protein